MRNPGIDLGGELADRYEIMRELGRGGSSTVYLATDRKHGRLVALKVLHAELDAALIHHRFLTEIRTTARLQHPHILPLFDSGEADGRLFYTMPYVEGESLRQRLMREQHLGLAEALRIITEVASALEYAHTRGIIHRDIKPENILLSATGHAMVADFGIAFAMDEARSLLRTDPSLTVGTPAYMSPEQAEGSRDLDGRCDMYSLACVLYETLAGDLPLRADTLQILRRLQQPLPSIRDIRPGVPGTIDRALRRALAPDRSERFTTMAEFVGALRQVTRFDILALGTPSVRAEGRTMAEASLTRDALACLALLARAGDRGLARGHVITLLWEDKADREGERLLEEILSEIAQAFGSPDAIAGVERLRLNPVLADSDIARFDAALASGRLADAAALYRGPFLDGFELQSSAFTRWARHTGAELAFEFSAVVERLAREAERRSDYHEAVRWWRRLVAQDPLNGRLALELMRALVAAGDRDAAIQHARIHEALIEEEIALPLDQAVVDLAASLEAGRPKAGTG